MILISLLLDINECDTDNGGCHEKANCENMLDGNVPKCTCKTGYQGDGKKCSGKFFFQWKLMYCYMDGFALYKNIEFIECVSCILQ